MNDDTSKAVEPQRKPKSKRLSSFIWILVLWCFVRLIAEMDGISWRRAFPTGIIVFGLWPATLFLGLSIFVPVRSYQTIFRWSALGSVLSSLSTVLFFDLQSLALIQIVTQQRILVVALLAGVVIHWYSNIRRK